MTMNPRNYDIDELQDIAGESLPGMGHEGSDARRLSRDGSDGPAGPGSGRARADDVARSNQYRELMLLEGAIDDLEKPYLDALPASYAAELVVFEWLEFLVETAGFKHALRTLRYYRTIDWLDERTEARLGEYLRSFEGGGSEPRGMDRSDHVLSLVYIARLAAMD